MEFDSPGLFTGRDCCSGKEAACEAVCGYREQAAMKPPTHPTLHFWPARRVKIADLVFDLASNIVCPIE